MPSINILASKEQYCINTELKELKGSELNAECNKYKNKKKPTCEFYNNLK